MGALGVHADPEGWLNAGHSVRTLMDSLDGELHDADRVAGPGLQQSWAGPVRDAFAGHWSGVRSRAEDTIDQGRRAAAAIIDFGGKLEDFVRRAAELEGHWLSFGLRLEADGTQFALPWGFEHLPPAHQVSFTQLLSESKRDVEAMRSDIEAAVTDVVTVLESLITALEDREVVELGVYAGIAGVWLDGYRQNLASAASDGWSVLKNGLDYVGPRALESAYRMVVDGSDGRAVEGVATKVGVGLWKSARVINVVDKFAGPALYLATVGLTAVHTFKTVEKKGWENGVEDHAGEWAGLAAGIAVTVLLLPVDAPVIAVVGVAVLGSVVAAGVGPVVQGWVDDNRASINQGFTDIGHGAEVTGKAIGRGLDDAGKWEARHAEELGGPVLTPVRSWLTR